MIHIILYRPEKPLNTGNIMRTCKVTGCSLHIIGPLSFSLDDKAITRSGLDYISDFSYHYYDSLDDFMSLYSDKDIYYITRYSNHVYSETDFSHPETDYYLMFGRESTGIPHDILREHPDKCLRIPMKPNARSLNLSNAVAIVTYEVLRQQGFRELATHETIKGEDFLTNEKDNTTT